MRYTYIRGGINRQKIIHKIIRLFCIFLVVVHPALAEGYWQKYEQPAGNTDKSPRMNYWVYIPDNANEKPPLIVYLHSSGCMWNRALNDPLPSHITNNVISGIQAVVLVPQLSGDYEKYWRDEMDSVNAIIERTINDFHIDRKRIAIAGYSLGGIGVWDIANTTPGRYSRILSVCGRVNYNIDIDNFLSCEGVRVYTARYDQTINSATAITFANSLAEKGVNATVITLEMAHAEVPEEIFKDADLLKWLWIIPEDAGNPTQNPAIEEH